MALDVNVLTNGWTIAGIIASFLVAAIALGLGLASIIQTNRLQKRERKERLLNEIIEWATNISRLNSYLLSLTESVRLKLTGYSIQCIRQLRFDLENLRDKGKYIKVTSNVACNKASDSVIKLQHELSNIANLLSDYIVRNEIVGDVNDLITTEDEMGNERDKNKDTVERHRTNIDPLCNSIMEEATKIKTRDIS